MPKFHLINEDVEDLSKNNKKQEALKLVNVLEYNRSKIIVYL